jgi:hypothetical protein
MSSFISNSKFICVIFLLLSLSTDLFAQRTDIIIMNNGDHITGEIKKLQYGIVTFKTDDAGTLSIKWDKIRHLISTDIFEVQVQDGRNYYGSLDTTYSVRQMIVKGKDQIKFLFKIYVVEITPIKNTFWDILDGHLKLGFNYAKGTATGQLTLGGLAKYRTRQGNTELNLNSIISFRDEQESSRKQDLTLTYQRFFEHKWFAAASVGLEQNTELGIKLRAITNIAAGYGIIHSNQELFLGMLGISLNRESFTDTSQATFNLEGLLALNYQLFVYDSPKASLTTGIVTFPGLTDWGRIRLNYDVTLSWEIIIDLYWDLSGYYSYDNKPTSGASSDDYGINTSFKYEF